MMKKLKSFYHDRRFPAEVISRAVRWYFRFQLSLREVEELLVERGVTVTYETIGCWCAELGKGFAHRVKPERRRPAHVAPRRDLRHAARRTIPVVASR